MRDLHVRVEQGAVIVGPPELPCVHLVRQQNYLEVAIYHGSRLLNSFVLTEAEIDRLADALELAKQEAAWVGTWERSKRLCSRDEHAG